MEADDLPACGANGVGGFSHGGRDGSQGFLGGDDDDRHDEEGHGAGSGEDGAFELEDSDEDLESEQSVDDRWHSGEVGDVDLDHP